MAEAAPAPGAPDHSLARPGADGSILATVNHLRPVPDPTPPPSPIEGESPSIIQLERWSTVLRMDCVRMLAVAKSGHLDSSLSAADIVTALYMRVLRHDPSRPDWPARDRFVLSKGHAAPILYAALARHAYFPLEDLMGLRKIGAQLQGHPDMGKTAGVEVSTGSLGQGLSMSLGIALALHLDDFATQRVFCLLSDGDCQEGQTWEAVTAAPHFAERGGSRLTAIVDYNHLQTDGTTEEVMDIGDMRAKFESFGWDAVEIDGHDMGGIVEALERSRDLDRPAAIIAQTKKGRGVSSMEGRFGFHGKPPTPEQADEALTELEALYKEQTAALEKATAEFEKVTTPADAGLPGSDEGEDD
jgi:transketolase